MTRRRFNEKDVIRTLLHQGVEIRCFRTGEKITLDTVGHLEREHLHELKLGGPDEPANCRYSLKEAHAIVTNGTPATTARSSKHRIAKTRGTRAEKFAVVKLRLDQPREKPRRYGNNTFRASRT
jgi:5-methylcytosine-specific restriction endonuclease McrA